MKEDEDKDDAKDECRVVLSRDCDMNEVLYWKVLIILEELVDFLYSEMIIKRLYDLLFFLWLDFEDSNAGVDHVLRVVSEEKWSGVNELVDLVEVMRVVKFIIEEEKGIKCGVWLDVCGVEWFAFTYFKWRELRLFVSVEGGLGLSYIRHT